MFHAYNPSKQARKDESEKFLEMIRIVFDPESRDGNEKDGKYSFTCVMRSPRSSTPWITSFDAEDLAIFLTKNGIPCEKIITVLTWGEGNHQWEECSLKFNTDKNTLINMINKIFKANPKLKLKAK